MTIKFVLDACSQNDSFVAKFLIEMFDLDVNEKIDNKTPLAIATQMDSVEMVDYLLERGAQIDDSLVESTIRRDKFLLLFTFIYHGYDVNSNQGRLGILASQRGNLEIFQYLVERGYDLENYGAECLYWALDKKRKEFSKYLLSKGVVYIHENKRLFSEQESLELFPSLDSFHLYLLRKIVLKSLNDKFVLFYGMDRDNYSILMNQVSFKRKRLEITNYPISFFNNKKANYQILYVTGQGSTFSEIKEGIKRRRI